MANFISVHILRISLTSCACAYSQPDFHHWPLWSCMCLWQGTYPIDTKLHPRSQGLYRCFWAYLFLTVAGGPGSNPGFCHWPAPVGCPVVSSSTCIPSWPWFNSFHCLPLLCMHSWGDITARKVQPDSRTLQPVHPQLAHILDEGSGPHH